MMKKLSKSLKRSILVLASLAMLLSVPLANVQAREEEADLKEWLTFFMICNEGMNNDGGNVGNTMMAISMQPYSGRIRLMMFTWDTFVEYEGYDVPQKIDMAFRNNGPEESVKVFDANFDMDIENYISLNYLNLASLIDNYGGVNVTIYGAEGQSADELYEVFSYRLQHDVADREAGFSS